MNNLFKFLCLILFLCLFLCLFLFLFLIPKKQKPCEQFKNNLDKINTWKQRIKELKLVPLHYLSYFNTNNINSNINSNNQFKPEHIFISIASYRDDQCSDTINNLIQHSDHPERLTIVICQQNSLFDEDCFARVQDKKGATLLIERLHYTQAKGPVYARYKIIQKYSGEEYFLQIDSHTRLIQSWDTILKNQLSLCPNPDLSILSQYPNEFQNVQKSQRNNPEHEKWDRGKLRGNLYIKTIEKDGFTRIQSDYTSTMSKYPFKSNGGWAAGFSFSKGKFILDIPFDPYLYLFFGEQMDIAIRSFTHGYDIYSPSVEIAYHIYERSHRKTFWELTSQKPLETLSRFRLYYKLGMLKKHNIPKEYHAILNDISKYSLGKVRTIEEYEKEAGISIQEEILN
jgi:hypothetical protein